LFPFLFGEVKIIKIGNYAGKFMPLKTQRLFPAPQNKI